MPFVPDYSDRPPIEEPRLIVVPQKSPIETALHEAVHVVAARLDGLRIAEVVDSAEQALTILVEPDRFTPAAMMAPEIYMVINGIAFDEASMSSDRAALVDCIKPEKLDDVRRRAREWLEMIFQCPFVLAAIRALSIQLDHQFREYGRMDGDAIHQIIDPILALSPSK